MELRLPEDASQSRAFDDELERGEVWQGMSGWFVRYAVQRDPVEVRDPEWDDRDALSCTESIGGHSATIWMAYSEATTIPGQRVVAFWKLKNGEQLVVTAFHPDRTRRGDLMAIVRSVQLQD